MTDDAIDICVAAQAREGKANTAVKDMIAKTLRVPKSDVEILRGIKSREKIVAVQVGTDITPAVEIERTRALLLNNIAC